MSHQSQIQLGMQRLAVAINAAKSQRGDLTALSTTDKTNLVAALNEVLTVAQNAASSGGASINDASVASTTETWSITKIAAELQALRDDILGGASAAFDTLNELAAAIQGNDSDIGTILTGLGNRLRVDAAQSLTGPQQQQGRDNLDVYSKAEIGDVTFDYVADIETILS